MLNNNDTHIFINWAAPANPNGVVNYTVQVLKRSLLDNVSEAIRSEVTAELELVVSTAVEAYTVYTVRVTPQTSAGEGMSVTDSFETPEEGKKRTHTIACE